MVHFRDTWEELILTQVSDINERGRTMTEITFLMSENSVDITWKYTHGFRFGRTIGLKNASFRIRLAILQELIADKILT